MPAPLRSNVSRGARYWPHRSTERPRPGPGLTIHGLRDFTTCSNFRWRGSAPRIFGGVCSRTSLRAGFSRLASVPARISLSIPMDPMSPRSISAGQCWTGRSPAGRVCRISPVSASRGRLLLLEHVRPGNASLGRVFDAFSPVVKRLIGPEINRRTVANIRRAGWTVILEENLVSDIAKLIVAKP
jgi:hypothetical protein